MRKPRRKRHITLSSVLSNARSKRRLVNSMSATKRINPDTPTNVLIFLPSKTPDTLILNSRLIVRVVYFNVVISVSFWFAEPAASVVVSSSTTMQIYALFFIVQ